MKTKINVMKKLTLFVAAFAFCAVLFKPVDVKAALTAPTGLTQTDAVTNSYTCSIEVEWNDTASYYAIETSLDRVNWTMQDDDWSLNYKTISNLTPGQTYYVRVTPIENGSKGSPAVLTATTAPRSTSTVKQTAAPASGTQITISYPATAGATGYAIYYGTSSSLSSATYYGQTASTSVTFNVAKNSGFYVFVIPHRNGWLSSMYSYAVVVSAPTAPKSVKVITGGDPDLKEVRASWKATSASVNTDGFQVELHQLRTNGKTKKLKTFTTSSYYSYLDMKHSKLFTDACRFRVRAYVTIDGKKVYGAWSSYCTYVPQAKTTKLKFITKSSATLKWKKVNGAASYDIYYKTSSSPSAKWKRIKKNVKGTSATVKYSSSSTYNYYYVQANKAKVGKKKITSPSPNAGKAYFFTEFKKTYRWY